MREPPRDSAESSRLTLLGSVSLQTAEGQIPFAAELGYQLLAYLAVKQTWVSRDELATLLWSDTTSTARQNLRQLILRVQRFPWLSGFEVERERLRWPVATDLLALRQALLQSPTDQALDLYTGPLLQGLEGYEDESFAEWVVLEREQLHGQWRNFVLAGIDAMSEKQRAEKSAPLLHSLFEADDLDEEILALYLEAVRGTKLKHQALKLYQDFRRRLHQDFDLEPSALTTQLAEQLEQDEVALRPTPLRSHFPLPTTLTSFVGREQEVAEALQLISESRLLTLTGPGGVGKTRLALEIAKAASFKSAEGTAFVTLAALRTADTLTTTIAEAVGLTLEGYQDPMSQLGQFFGEQAYLLVLDNFEHLLEGSVVVSALLKACPHLKVLVTSRERLNVSAEWTLPVAGLPFPEKSDTSSSISSHGAVTLFVERARRVQPRFNPDEEEMLSIASICRRVQGLPLAIELAAVWVRAESCGEIDRAIGENLDFLASPARDADARHRSIRATLDYSWELLSAMEKEVFKKLSAFQGGISREAASLVAAANGALLAALVDKSLLTSFTKGRYDLHPLVKQYAAEKLAEDSEQAKQTGAAHAAFFTTFVGATERELQGPGQAVLLKTLELEHDNLREALNWTRQDRTTSKHFQLLNGLWRFWWLHGYLGEGRQWLEGSLVLESEDLELKRQVIRGAGVLSWAQADFVRAKVLFEEGFELAQTADDSPATAEFLNYLALIAQEEGNTLAAVPLYEKSLRLQRVLSDIVDRSIPLNGLGLIAWGQEDLAKAKVLLEESVTVSRELGDQASTAIALNNLGLIICDQGDHDLAFSLVREALSMRWGLESRWGLASSFAQMACLSTAQGEFARAAYFWGKAETLREELGTTVIGIFLDRYRLDLAKVRQALDTTTFESAWADGRVVSVADAVRIALGEPFPPFREGSA